MKPPLERPQAESVSRPPPIFTYIRDPAEITRQSFARLEEICDFSPFPEQIQPLARRLIHACGNPELLDFLTFSPDAVRAGMEALRAGSHILCDSNMTEAGITLSVFEGQNRLSCFLDARGVRERALAHRITRSAAALDYWLPHLEGSIIVIGNAPTALFRLLELLDQGADKPALIIGMPVGLIGAAESKQALIERAACLKIAYVTLQGRHGGSALACAAVNALVGLAADSS